MLNHFDSKVFLERYWQKKPLLIRNALPDFESPITPEELLGLSMEGISNSRIIEQHKKEFKVKHGPFSKRELKNLSSPWTILVQEVDKYVPPVAKILEHFSFIPRWRIDDIMISYAEEGAGVGPHIDNYDVFLIQGAGQRRWKWAKKKIKDEEWIEGRELRILKDPHFDFDEVLNPGDILYLPPRVAHDGVAVGDGCMTYSVGFRAPTQGQIVSSIMNFYASKMDEEKFYEDPDLKLPRNPSEFSKEVIKKLRLILERVKLSDEDLISGFGSFVTLPGQVVPEPPRVGISAQEFLKVWAKRGICFKNESSQFAYYNLKNKVLFFSSGMLQELPKKYLEVVQVLGKKMEYEPKEFPLRDPEILQFLNQLFLDGHLYFES